MWLRILLWRSGKDIVFSIQIFFSTNKNLTYTFIQSLFLSIILIVCTIIGSVLQLIRTLNSQFTKFKTVNALGQKNSPI